MKLFRETALRIWAELVRWSSALSWSQKIGLGLLLAVVVGAWRFTRRRNSVQAAPASERQSYLYVGMWLYWDTFKSNTLGSVIAGLLAILSFIELIGPFTHMMGGTESQHMWLTAVLFVVAVALVAHHRLLGSTVYGTAIC
jgi:hypothetical protein